MLLHLPRFRVVFAVLCLLAVASALRAAPVTVLATGDTQGHVGPCASCPMTTGLGGLARRGTLIDRAAAEGATLVLDAGHGLMGGESYATEGRIIAVGYQAIGYDAVNLGYRDFRLGKQATLDAVAAGNLPAVSANLYHAGDHEGEGNSGRGERLFDPFVVVERAGRRFALVGLTEQPAGLDALPHLKRQLEGVVIEAAGDAVAEILPRASEAADAVVVLFYGSAVAARELTDTLAAAGNDTPVPLIVAAGDHPPSEPGATLERDPPAIAWTHKHGTRLTRVALAGDAATANAIEFVDVTADTPRSERVERVIAPLSDADLPAGDEPAQGGGKLYSRLPRGESLEAGRSYRLDARDDNRGLALFVDRVEIHKRYAGHAAPAGQRWLVLAASFENQLAFDLMMDLDYPEPVGISSLPRQLFLLIDGKRIARLADEPKRFMGHLPTGFTLARVGSIAPGKLVFPIPEQGVDSLSLRFYHDQYAPLRVNLMGKDNRNTAATDEPALGPKANDLMSFAVYGHDFRDEHAGRAAPEGMRFVAVDLRGRSNLTLETDARALDADAAADKKAKLGEVMDYLKAPKMLQVEVDGEYAYTRLADAGGLEPVPPLLPDAMAGGEAVFLVPDDAESIDLALHFPEFRDTGGRRLGMPEPMRFTLRGEGGPAEPRQSIAVINDNPTPVGVMAQRVVERYGNVDPIEAGGGRSLLVVTTSFKNNSDEGGMFNVTERFAFDHGGGKPGPLRVASPGGATVGEPIWLPTNRRRTVELVFDVPAGTESGRLTYSGVSVATAVDLTLDGGAVAQAEASSPPSGEETGTPSDPAIAESDPEPKPDAVSESGSESDSEAAPFTDRPPATPEITVAPADNRNIAIEASAANPMVTLAVSGAAYQDQFGATEADTEHGKTFIVLDAGFTRNAKAPSGEAYRIDPLHEQLIGVINGRQLVHARRARSAENQLPREVLLREAGESVTGRIAFEVPEAGVETFDAYLIDELYGPIHLPLLPRKKRPALEEPALPWQRNEAVEVGVYGYELRDTFRRYRSNEETVWLVFDVRGRSLLRSPPPAVAAPGEPAADNPAAVPLNPPARHGLPVYWRDWHHYTQLVLDGDTPVFVTGRYHDLLSPMRFLSGVTAGGEIGFEVNRSALNTSGSIELVLGFEPVAIPGEAVVDLKPLRFQVTGERPSFEPAADPIVRVNDLDLQLEVLGQRTPKAFGGYEPRDGHRWLAVDYAVTATNLTGTMFSATEMTRLLDESGERHQWHRRTRDGDDPPPNDGKTFWIPPGDRRTYTLLYRLPAGVNQPRLFYGGTLEHQPYALNELLRLEGVEPVPDTAARPENDPTLALDGVKVYHPQRDPMGIAGVGLTPEQVNTAIDNGRDFLWQHLQDNSSERRPVGTRDEDLPAMLALVHCDAHKRYPEFDRAVRAYIHRAEPKQHSSYQNGLLAMLIEGYGDAAFVPKLEQAARWLVEAQGEDGTWSYRAPVPSRFFPDPEPMPEPEEDAVVQVVGGQPIERPEVPDTPLLRTQSWALGKDGDNSTSQFAMLGLWSAARTGFVVDDDVWRRAIRAITDRQQTGPKAGPFGGWAYTRPGTVYGSMTCAGVCTAALALNQLDPDRTARHDLRIRNGVSWLARHFAVAENPGTDKWQYYYIYSLERVGQILGTEFIGEHEWYPLGAKSLVTRQNPDGSWGGIHHEKDPRIATAFALLFLTRATPTLDAEPEHQPSGPGQLVTGVTLPNRTPHVYLILDASGSMMAEVGGKPKFDIARDAVKDMIRMLPEDSRVALRAYGHRRRAIEDGAEEDTQLVIDWGRLDKREMAVTLDALRPRGKTPLALSLQRAASDLPAGDEQLLVILLTDGGEDSGGAPVDAAATLGSAIKGRFYIVGFDINRSRWVEQLRAIADAGGGVYWPVREAAALTQDLEAIVYPRPPAYRLLRVTENVEEAVAVEPFGGEPVELEPGRYRLAANYLGHDFEAEFWINPEATTRVELNAADLVPAERVIDRGPAATRESAPPRGDSDAPNATSNFCTNCGSRLSPDTKFCTNCGHRVGE